MDVKTLQKWTTVRMASSVSSITQPASEWLDLHDYEDVTLTLEVAELTGAATCFFETAPTRQESTFVPLVGGFTVATGVRVDAAPAIYAPFPLARFLRWRFVNGGGGFDVAITFRVMAACHAPGLT